MARRVVLLALALLAVATAGASAKRLVGSAHDDALRGTTGADVLEGRGGADLLDGRGGRDRLLGGAGDDRLQAFDGRRDRLACGAGADIVAVDASDTVSSTCEVVSRQISRDRFSGGPGQHATEVEPHAVAHGSTVVAVFQVGRIVDGGATAIGWASSRDGGRTWQAGLLPGIASAAAKGQFARASDPVVAYDAVHEVWLAATLALTPGERSALAVSRSVDGRSWSTPVLASTSRGELAYDKEWIACDNWVASPFRGRCYLSYSDLTVDRIATRTSTDGGATWSGSISPPGNAGRAAIEGRYAPGVQPVARPNGDLVIVYYDERRLSAVRSTDGGATYSAPVAVAPTSFAEQQALRAAPLPTVTVDGAGTVYAAWADCSRRPACDSNDTLISRSPDGSSWTPAQRVATGLRGDAVLPALAADESAGGRLALTHYLRKGDRLGVRMTTSVDGGNSWSRPVRLDAESVRFDWLASANGAMVGDYVATAITPGRAVAVFALAAAPAKRLNEGVFAASLPFAAAHRSSPQPRRPATTQVPSPTTRK